MDDWDKFFLGEGRAPLKKVELEPTLWERVRFYVFAVLVASLIIFAIALSMAHAQEFGTASWYSVASCRREGTSGIMANGKELKDDRLTCASWFYPFGTLLAVTNIEDDRTVRVLVTDRGPAKRLVKKGRVIDLSRAAFEQIGDLRKGLIRVEVKEVRK